MCIFKLSLDGFTNPLSWSWSFPGLNTKKLRNHSFKITFVEFVMIIQMDFTRIVQPGYDENSIVPLSFVIWIQTAGVYSFDLVLSLSVTLDIMVMILPVCSRPKWTVTRTGGCISVGRLVRVTVWSRSIFDSIHKCKKRVNRFISSLDFKSYLSLQESKKVIKLIKCCPFN